MALLYNRKIKLEVVDIETNVKYIFDGLRIAFDFVKSWEGVPNSGSVTIYNVAEEARAPLDKVNNVVNVIAGYGEDINPVLTGTILKTETERETADIVTEIQIGDGALALANAQVNKVFPKNNTELDIIREAILQLQNQGVGLNNDFNEDDFKVKLPRAVTVSDTAKAVLSEYTSKRQYRWSIQDSQLLLLKYSDGTSEDAFRLAPETGLIGTPKTSFNNITFNTLLLPGLSVGRKVVLEGTKSDAAYVILKLNGRGDNFGNEFGYSCEAQIL